MDGQDAPSAEMRRPPRADPLALDDASVERLLSGTLPAAAAPPGYAGVARLLAATVGPPSPRELSGQAAVLAELRAVTRGRRAAPVRPARPRRRRAGLAVVVVVGALATGGVAAATGHLPGPVREAARSVLGPAGGTPTGSSAAAPVPAANGTVGAGAGGSATTVGPGPRTGPAAAGPAAGPALDGLCLAYQKGKGGDQGGKLDAAAFEELAAAAGGADRVEAFCEKRLAADVQVKGPKEAKPKDPPDDAGQGQGAPPSSGGGTSSGSGTGGSGSADSGSGQAQTSPVPAPSPSPPNRG